MNEIDGRRYRILAVLGKGGFGKVYRARMIGSGGFEKEVAIKLMRDETVPEDILQRFRDEARILGLVRDRAIVSVDPPTKLSGRWAVVMEYVDGASIQRLLRLGAFPPAVTAEIMEETARALDKVYRQPGPNGDPLRLLHRDIKPSNLQITQDGEIKILDFGIARADFEAREAHTVAYIGGTRGFIAPERLMGDEGPSGDVYSLGVTMHVMLTGEKPSKQLKMGLAKLNTEGMSEDLAAMMTLAFSMMAGEPEERPTAREVEEKCRSLRRKMEGTGLRRWAEENVPRAATLKKDDLVGQVFTETIAGLPNNITVEGLESETFSTGRARSGVVLGVAAFAGIMAVVASFGVLIGSLGLYMMVEHSTADVGSPREKPELSSREAEPTKNAASPVSPKGVKNSQSDGETPSPQTPKNKETDEQVEPKPEPDEKAAPAEKAPAVVAAPVVKVEEEAAATFSLTLASVPGGADVFVDGRAIGATPLAGVQLTAGKHRLKMVASDGLVVEQHITVGRRAPSRYVWRGGANIEAHHR